MRVVIAGAGSAGCVLASRLSERSDVEVTLVEAGPDYPDPIGLPVDLARGTRNSMVRHDWGLAHRPTPVSPVFPFPRGRVVGGSSAVNTCIALRPSPADHAEWVTAGLSEWSWERCLPSYVRLERDLDRDDPWHGREGPLPLRRHRPEELTPWQAAFLEATELLGYARCDDSNDPRGTGAGPHTMNKIDGRRISAAEAWLTPAVRARPNLRIVARTRVDRVLFAGRRATGVDVKGPAGHDRIDADEVIVATGAIATPHLLMRSGVGPRATLEGWGVDLVHDAPGVAARLLDHPGFAMFFLPRWGRTRRGDPLIQTVLRYQSDDEAQPNDMIIQPGSRVPSKWAELPFCSIMSALGKPHGHGRIAWKSARPDARPHIEGDALAHPVDRRRAVDAMARAAELAATSPMRAIARHLVPGPRAVRDRDVIGRWIRRFTDSGYHPCGTAPIRCDAVPDGVVDTWGRVHGVEGLRVCDASIFPTIPSSNIHLAVLMAAEHVAASWEPAR